MRILLVAGTLIPKSGWGTYAAGVATGLKDAGHEVLVLVNEANDLIDVPQKTGLPPPLTLLDSVVARLRAKILIARTVGSFQPDVIHVLLEPYALAMPGTSVPWVMNLHGTYGVLPLHMPKVRGALLKAYRRTSGCLAASDYTASRVLDAVEKADSKETAEALQKKIRVLTLGIDTSSITMNAPHADALKRILFVGEVKPRKGVAELIEGFAAFKKLSGVPCRLDIVGKCAMEDPYVSALLHRIKELGLQQDVTLHGETEDTALDALYSKASAFAMLSISHGDHFEGFGLVFLEASARGIPTVGSFDSGCREAIDEGKSGYAVPAGEADTIAERLRWILEENKIKPENCRRWAEAHSLKRQTEECVELYEAVTK